MKKSNDEKILADFEAKSNNILARMAQALAQAQKKVDFVKYQQISKKIKS